ncbi:MAG: cyclic nucleotide-binding domain-containing protein [Gammaproteobacteria bacterium]|nr:cyclic nucleotide-binding domain-containing protein [Gammaproteobacteria bacterium]
MFESNDSEAEDASDIPRGFVLSGYGTAFKDQLCRMLESTQMFKRLQSKYVQILSDYCMAYDVEPGIIIMDEGKFDAHMFLLIKGKLEVSKKGENQNISTLATILPGKTIGEMSLIDGQPHSASVTTLTQCTVILLSRGSLNRLARQHPRVALEVVIKISQIISNRLRQTSGKLVDLL